MFLPLDPRIFFSLWNATHYAICTGILRAWSNCYPQKPQEPDFIASMVINSTSILSSKWSSLLNPVGISVSIGAVYCHQKPSVKFAGIKTHNYVELGDILFVRQHRDKTGNKKNQAVLFQAKISSQQPYRLNNNDLDQLDLYSKWPEFEYIASGSLNSQKRNVFPKRAHKGAEYLLMDDRDQTNPDSGLSGKPGTYPVGVCKPNSPLSDYGDLSSALVLLLCGISGRPFSKTPPTTNGWSRMVWDLIDVGLNKSFKRTRSRIGSSRRDAGTLDGVSFFKSSFLTKQMDLVSEILGEKSISLYDMPEGGAKYPDKNNEKYEDDQPGISLIIIETAYQGEENLINP